MKNVVTILPGPARRVERRTQSGEKQRAEQYYAADQRQAYGLVVVDQQAAITRYVEEVYGNGCWSS